MQKTVWEVLAFVGANTMVQIRNYGEHKEIYRGEAKDCPNKFYNQKVYKVVFLTWGDDCATPWIELDNLNRL